MTETELALVVTDRRLVADDVVGLELRAPDGADLPAWAPGAHVDLVLFDGLARQYSLCGDPHDRSSYRVAILRQPDGRGGSAFVHDRLAVGAEVGVRGPRHHFALVDADAYLFLAGGIGITPLLPMIAELAATGRPWQLLYGGRSRSSLAFVDELVALGPVDVRPQDEFGLLDLPAAIASAPPGAAVYCCGPEPLLAAVEALHATGWATGDLHVERFAARPGALAGDGRAPGTTARFDVECARSGVVVTVDPDVSILHALEATGMTVLSSCQEGTCGTCETGVLDGVPDHRDSVLTAAERDAGDVMMICCSRARSDRLVLDL